MLIAVITGPDVVRAMQQIVRVQTQVDLLELRVDYFDDLNVVSAVMNVIYLPVILTLRSQVQGGKFCGDQAEKVVVYERLASLSPTYIDIDTEMSPGMFIQFQQKFPHIQWIYSYHNMTQTPQNLVAIFADMQSAGANMYKIVTYANTALDALHMVDFIKAVNRSDLIAFCMGEAGQWTRLLAPAFGGKAMHYLAAQSEHAVAEGQLTVAQWHQDYHSPKIDNNIDIYALIGSPVSQSMGHIFHNQVFKRQANNAIYVKILLTSEELPAFFTCFKNTALKGLSVTMPLKSAILPFIHVLEDNANQAGAVNTVIFAENIVGKNTDGDGAIQVLREKTALHDKKIMILGVGNTARAIAIAAKNHGAIVTMVARNISAQHEWAQKYNIALMSFAALSSNMIDYDILINATPIGMSSQKNQMIEWLVPELFLPGRIVLDCVISDSATQFLQLAAAQGCECIPGKEMFFGQAQQQFVTQGKII